MKVRISHSANHYERNYTLFNGDLFPDKYFGQSEADIEWDEDNSLSSRLFVHTNSYEIFKKQSNLFVFGRRGTGKTALIKMLDFEIQKNIEKSYSYSKIIAQEDTFYKLTLELRNVANDLSKNEITHIIKDKLIWVIYTSAMISVIEKNRDLLKTDTYLKIVADYLRSLNFIQDTNRIVTSKPITKALDIFSDHFEKIEYDPSKAGIALIKATKELYSPEYEDALNAMVAFLTKRHQNCLLLIDSQELYDFKDKLSEAATSGLMDAVLQVYNQNRVYKVFAKVAFPSEIFPHLNPANQSKTMDKGHFIFWKFKELLMFTAKRYCQLLSKEKLIGMKCENIEDEQYQDFIYKYIPKKTMTFCEFEFETFPYILSHTQKKPREIILLFNLILTLAKQNDIPFNKLTSTCIREGTNARIEDLSSGVLDMYKSIYPNAVAIVHKTFNESNNVISFGDLHKQLTEANALLAEADMTKQNAERLFLETGIIGILQKETDLPVTGKSLISANFEYQIKGVLTIQSKDQLVIHPIFYQGLNIKVDSNSLVYPKPSETEHEELKSLLNP